MDPIEWKSEDEAYAKLVTEDRVYFMKETNLVIGRD
jgi:hypothetical protein